MQDLGKTPGLNLSTTWSNNIETEIRITDTGGKVDESRDKTTYPNPGQYSEISIGFMVYKNTNKTVSASNELNGTITQRIIVLRYIGGKAANVSLDFNIEMPTNNESLYLRKGLFGGHFKHLSDDTTDRRTKKLYNTRDREFERNRKSNNPGRY
jgi:hypothetical protein